jgi:hypothetical protein
MLYARNRARIFEVWYEGKWRVLSISRYTRDGGISAKKIEEGLKRFNLNSGLNVKKEDLAWEE